MTRKWLTTATAGVIAIVATSIALTPGARHARAADNGKAKPAITTDYFGAGGMQVTFVDDVKPTVRADFLKAELENYVRVFKPDHDYLATPYDAAGKGLGGAMIYVHAREKVMPLDQYQQGR